MENCQTDCLLLVEEFQYVFIVRDQSSEQQKNDLVDDSYKNRMDVPSVSSATSCFRAIRCLERLVTFFIMPD